MLNTSLAVQERSLDKIIVVFVLLLIDAREKQSQLLPLQNKVGSGLQVQWNILQYKEFFANTPHRNNLNPFLQ